jgi:hypothetical protein
MATIEEKENATKLKVKEMALGFAVVNLTNDVVFTGTVTECTLYIQIQFDKLNDVKYK